VRHGFTGYKQDFVVEEIPDPDPGEGDGEA